MRTTTITSESSVKRAREEDERRKVDIFWNIEICLLLKCTSFNPYNLHMLNVHWRGRRSLFIRPWKGTFTAAAFFLNIIANGIVLIVLLIASSSCYDLP